MTGLRYVSLLLATVSAILLGVGVTWYAILRQPLFLIVQSWVITFNVRLLILNLCVLIMAVLAYKLVHT